MMFKGTLLYIMALYLLGRAVQMIYEAEYDNGYKNGYKEGAADTFRIHIKSEDVHRES